MVNFKNAIIIMTSNVGSQYLKNMSRIGFNGGESEGVAEGKEDTNYRDKVMESLRESFRPEFLNRIDEILIFKPLGRGDIAKIVDIQIGLIAKKLLLRNIKLDIGDAAREYLITEGFSSEFGARPLKRLIQKVILDKLADKIVRGELKDGGKIKVNFKADSLVFSS